VRRVDTPSLGPYVRAVGDKVEAAEAYPESRT